MIANQKEFNMGLGLFVCFWVVFYILMSPIFAGKNLLGYMDNLYNTISKKSSYYIPKVQKELDQYSGVKEVSFSVSAKGEQAVRLTRMFEASRATVTPEGEKLKVSGDMGSIIANILADSEAMFNNDGKAVSAKYGGNEKAVLFDWWNAATEVEKELNKDKRFKAAKILHNTMTKAIEPAYNYYGIEAVPIKDKWGTVVISLAGYVFYTLWFGFSILFMFEGWGLKLEH